MSSFFFFLDEFLQGIDKVSVVIHCAWHIITTQLVLANMIIGKYSISTFGPISSTQENDTLTTYYHEGYLGVWDMLEEKTNGPSHP